jgi:hypothetical protein
LIRSEGLDVFCHFPDNLHEFGGFSRRYPRKLKTAGFGSHVFHQVLKKSKFAPGVVITFQVMAFSGMSPGYPDTVRSLPQSREKKL